MASLGWCLLFGCGETADQRGGSGPNGGPPTPGGGSGGSSNTPSGNGGSGAGIPIDVTPEGGGGTGGTPICNELQIVTQPVTPTVLILVDNSTSMFEPPNAPQLPWDMLYEALMNPTTGVVAPLQEKVRFGFSNYRGVAVTAAENDAACAQMATVPFELNNYQAIQAIYDPLGDERSPPGMNWQTPTGHAVRRAAAALAAYEPNPPGPKYILLVTDGNPDTCQMKDPQCGQDVSIKAVQEARAMGIGTFVVGIGDIVVNPNNGCNAQQARCGSLHLQDVANAGLGLPVQAPPADYLFQPCVDAYGRVLQAAYTPATTENAPFFTANSGAELQTALQGLLNNVVSCTVEMNAIVQGDASLGVVTLGAQPAGFGDPNGWRLEPDNFSVTLQGTACDAFKNGAPLHIAFPCPPPGQPPLVVPR